jgi:hypothetical protein
MPGEIDMSAVRGGHGFIGAAAEFRTDGSRNRAAAPVTRRASLTCPLPGHQALDWCRNVNIDVAA